jgi:hypothetical protein
MHVYGSNPCRGAGAPQPGNCVDNRRYYSEGDAFRERVSYGLSLSGDFAFKPFGRSSSEPRGDLLTKIRSGK